MFLLYISLCILLYLFALYLIILFNCIIFFPMFHYIYLIIKLLIYLLLSVLLLWGVFLPCMCMSSSRVSLSLSFIVDACTCLMDHLDTEGLFRKSGSVVRVKSLRVSDCPLLYFTPDTDDGVLTQRRCCPVTPQAKLDQGEDGLPTALPLDIAGLLKQFFRELPEPVLTVDLHSGFLKAQELPSEEERTSATVLLSCVLPDRNLNTLRYFFSFLKTVSQRYGARLQSLVMLINRVAVYRDLACVWFVD